MQLDIQAINLFHFISGIQVHPGIIRIIQDQCLHFLKGAADSRIGPRIYPARGLRTFIFRLVFI
jgi:hypothetical protein